MNAIQYLIVTGGDGYSTQIVDESTLEDAYLATIYGDAKDCPAHERDMLLQHLRDPDNWTHNQELGRVRYDDRGCDGYIQIIRLAPTAMEVNHANR